MGNKQINKIQDESVLDNGKKFDENTIFEKFNYDRMKANPSLEELIKKYGWIHEITDKTKLYYKTDEELEFLNICGKIIARRIELGKAIVYTYMFSNGEELVWRVFRKE